MLVVGFPAPMWGTNCWVVAPAAGEQCVVIDPGGGVSEQLDAVLEEHRLAPVAVLLTHGHIDHTFSVTPVCGARGIPALIHPDDDEMLTDPAVGLGDMGRQLARSLTWSRPDDVRPLVDGETLSLAGLDLLVRATPGHTRGSVVFAAGPELFSGDLLFAGSVGRTDLPGGSWEQLQDSLRRVVLPMPDDVVVRPGHGPDTTVGVERRANPFLADLTAVTP